VRAPRGILLPFGSVKLIFAIDALAPPRTGVGRYALELATRLIAHPGLEALRFYLRGRSWAARAGDLDEGRPGRLPLPLWLGRWRLRRLSRDHLFHSPNFFLPPGVERGVITIHDLSVLRFPETHPPERHADYERQFGRSLERAAHLITDSQAVRREVIERLPWPADGVTAIPLGVSPRFAPGPASSSPAPLSRYGLRREGYALCVSTLEPRKRIDRLLAAWRALPAALRGRFPLALAGGKGWLNQPLLACIREGEREGWLRHLGFVADADLPALYSGARAFFFPSIYEGYGLPVLEAMACGTPVVTSPFSSLPEVAGGAALLADPDDAGALRDAIGRALEDEAWRAQARERGLEVARGRTWEQCAQRTLAVYRQLAPPAAAG